MNNAPGPNTVFAVSGARVFDGKRILVDHAVLVKDGRVSEIVPSESVPQGMVRHHHEDCTVMPGLIDTHVHFMRWQGPQFLAFGVTTVRDTGNDLTWILDRRAQWQDKPWPRILCTGPLLDGPIPTHEFVSRSCSDLADAVDAVRQTSQKGVDGVKLYVGLPPEWLPSMVEAGHEAGRKVSMHCRDWGVLPAARAGVDEFFHLTGILADVLSDGPPGSLEERGGIWLWGTSEFTRKLDRQRAVADDLARSGITATPTLAVWDAHHRIYTADSLLPEDLRYTPSSMIKWQAVSPDPTASQMWLRTLESMQKFLPLLLDRDVLVLAGSDVPACLSRPGLSLWRELSLLVESGMSPPQALRAATSDAAEFLGQHELGNLTPGSVADMVLVKGNPLERIPYPPDIVMIIHNGISYRPQDLQYEVDQRLEDEPWALQLKRHWERRPPAEV